MNRTRQELMTITQIGKLAYSQRYFSAIPCTVRNIFLPADRDTIYRISDTDMILIHYDISMPWLLAEIYAIRQRMPQVVILMTTHHLDDRLALWALRLRLWDCLVLPDEHAYVKKGVSSIQRMLSHQKGEARTALPTPVYYSSIQVLNDELKQLSAHLQPALEYISKNVDKPLRTSDIGLATRTSVARLNTLFRQETGLSAKEYVTRFRVESARNLLANSRIHIGTVARLCGYDSLPYFVSVFKRYVGYSPSRFRLEIQTS